MLRPLVGLAIGLSGFGLAGGALAQAPISPCRKLYRGTIGDRVSRPGGNMNQFVRVWSVITASLLTANLSQAQPAANDNLPADIDPESLSRLPALTRDQMDEAGKEVWDLVNGDRRPLTGPGAVSMYSPQIAEGFHIINQYLRFGSELEPRDFEVAIMQAAWEFEQVYEWSAHEGASRRIGVPEDVINAIKYDTSPDELGAKDRAIIRFARALLRDHKVSSELYAEIVGYFGERGMVDLATIIGDYVMVGFVMTAADQHLPANMQNTLPER
jgi:4-carboxymuconolactone decarboxylase